MNSSINTHESINMAQESSNNLNFQTRPTSMPQTQNASRNPMQANLGHPAQEQPQTVPQVEMPEQVPDDITSCFNNHSESASSQTRPVLPDFDPSNEHTYPPLGQSAPR